MISGIGWVSELIAIAGGVDIFPELAGRRSASDRITTPEAVVGRAPEIIIGSWCGKKFNKEKVAARPGFDAIPAVRNRKLYEIKSPLILQPGPAALTDGLLALEKYHPRQRCGSRWNNHVNNRCDSTAPLTKLERADLVSAVASITASHRDVREL